MPGEAKPSRVETCCQLPGQSKQKDAFQLIMFIRKLITLREKLMREILGQYNNAKLQQCRKSKCLITPKIALNTVFNHPKSLTIDYIQIDGKLKRQRESDTASYTNKNYPSAASYIILNKQLTEQIIKISSLYR